MPVSPKMRAARMVPVEDIPLVNLRVSLSRPRKIIDSFIIFFYPPTLHPLLRHQEEEEGDCVRGSQTLYLVLLLGWE
jgi:hypothetical protein